MEFNCWLLFRALVDYILINDFASYFMFVFSYWEMPETITILDIGTYALGLTLVIFNWFIKIDALRVVKDFAWC